MKNKTHFLHVSIVWVESLLSYDLDKGMFKQALRSGRGQSIMVDKFNFFLFVLLEFYYNHQIKKKKYVSVEKKNQS